VKAYWEQMCWLGPENYGALPLNMPVPTGSGGGDSGGMEGVDGTSGGVGSGEEVERTSGEKRDDTGATGRV